MNTVNMPGFTGETSLYKRSDRYQRSTLFTDHQEAVFPAQFGEISGLEDGFDGMPDLDGGGIPRTPVQLEKFSEVPLMRETCFYPCRPRCFSIAGSRFCFHPCQRICLWF